MNILYWIGGFITVLATIIIYYPTFLYIFLFVLYSAILVLIAIAGTIYVHFLLTARIAPPPRQTTHSANVLYGVFRSEIFDLPKPITNSSNLQIIFGRTVDGLLLQIIEFTLRDFISSWLGTIVREPQLLMDIIREDLWNAIQKLHERATKIDIAKMIAVDMVVKTTVHFEKMRIAKSRVIESGDELIFATNTYLSSETKELEFLRKISEIIIIFLLPKGYSLSPLKNLLSEIISYKLLYSAINMLTSPDYINQKIVEQIESRLSAAAINKRSYEYAASFNDFVKIIQHTTSMDDLILMRRSIVNDIVQATTMQNLQRAKGVGTDINNPSKSEQAAAAKLKRYIQQLSYAKTQCEKSLSSLGYQGYISNDLNLSLSEILSSVTGRRCFILFLEPLKASALIGFYTSVEELKQANKTSWYQLGAEIFYTYIRAPSSEIDVDKSERKRMESFLLGDVGPEVFYEVQENVIKTIEDKYYAPFLLSSHYTKLKNSLASDEIKEIALSACSETLESCNMVGESDFNLDWDNHSTYSRTKLEELQEKLDHKVQALDAMKLSVKPESKVLNILDKEVDWLRSEKRQLEAHLTRTEIWGEHLGKWRAIVQSVEVTDTDKDIPQFMILVQVDEDVFCTTLNHQSSNDAKQNNEGVSSGWVVLRSLTQFHELQRKLRPISSEIRSFDLPSTTLRSFFLKNDKSSLEKAKGQIQRYLNFIMEDDHLYQSEAVYVFLSPSSEHLKNVTPSPKKSKFSLATLFKSQESNKNDTYWGPCGPRQNEEDISLYLDGGSSDSESNSKSQSEDGKDSIAEPIYALLGEIFDMGGVFKWLRKSIISFVQITYGRTINRQIRDSINFLFEETMLHHYFSSILKSFWPGGVFVASCPERTQDEQHETAKHAKALLTNNIPDVLSNLVGAQTAKNGAVKIFDEMQSHTYNKQLFYEFLEILMIEMFPEIRQLTVSSKSTPANGGEHTMAGHKTS